MRRVCVTGIGIVTSLGQNVEQVWGNVLDGHSGANDIKAFDAKGWPTQFACEVPEYHLPEGACSKDYEKYLNRPTRFGMGAAHEAVRDSGIEGQVDPLRMGVSVGSNIGALSSSLLVKFMESLSKGAHDPVKKIVEEERNKHALKNHPGTYAGLLSMTWGAQGALTTIQTACASSGQAIGNGFQQIQRGDVDVVLAGGADSLSAEMLLAGFCLIGALSKRNEDPQLASRPFDRDRDGFVAGEGASILILEELEHAKKRGAKIYAELAGYGETASAFRITDLPENGRGIVEAMHYAVKQGRVNYDDVHYINAHGTSTELNDRVEALAIRKVFGSRGHLPKVSSTKSMTGHLISAAGALESAFSVLAIRDQIAPPTINLVSTDCGDDIDFVANEAKSTRIFAALSNSIGFGGSNSSLLFKQWGDS